MKLMRMSPIFALSLLATQPVAAEEPSRSEAMLDCYFSIGVAKAIYDLGDENQKDPKVISDINRAFAFYKGILMGSGVDINAELPKYLDSKKRSDDKSKNTQELVENAGACTLAANRLFEPGI